ncbi:MAG TPA: hypothetical protein VF174_08910 [Micromonosporaceae bacterium]
MRTPSLAARVQLSRQRLLNHPGHPDQKVHGGGGGDDFDDDPDVGELDEGGEGYGRDPSGLDYTENDVDIETGEPKFSPEYREKYGQVTSESVHDSAAGHPIAVVETSKGAYLHVGSDERGTKNREVIQEFTKKEAGKLGTEVFAVYNGDKPTGGAAGVTVRPNSSNPTQDGVTIQWANGRTDSFDGEAGNDAAFELQESFSISGGTA